VEVDVLTDTDTESVEHRPIAIIFDEDEGTLNTRGADAMK